MADIFCDDGGSNTAPHETWAKAATTFGTAVSASSAGDDIILGHDHSETPSANTTYTFPGTPASPNRVISATSTAGGSTITYNKADNIQIDLTLGFDLTWNGTVQSYGISLRVGDNLTMQSSVSKMIFDDSIIELDSAAALFLIGVSTAKNSLNFKNTDVNFSGGGTGAGFFCDQITDFNWKGGVLSWTGTQPTALFDGLGRADYIHIAGVDLSSITSALIDVSDDSNIHVELHHCLLNSSVALTTGTINNIDTRILMLGCDDTTGNDLYRLEYVDFWGSTVHDDAIFLNASDGTQAISWKMVSTANAAEFSEPTKSPPIYAWVDATGSTTFTVSFVWDSASDLQDDEVWLEIEFLEASADTDSAFADDRMADITATPADQDNNAESWTGTGGFSNENTQEVAVTATVNRVGPVIARVCLAKPSTTIYVDPLMVKS